MLTISRILLGTALAAGALLASATADDAPADAAPPAPAPATSDFQKAIPKSLASKPDSPVGEAHLCGCRCQQCQSGCCRDCQTCRKKCCLMELLEAKHEADAACLESIKSARFQHSPNLARYGYFFPQGCCGAGCPPAGHYHMAYSVNPYHFDPRDAGVYAAQGWGVPITVPLAPMVEHQYNYGWGVPSSRLTGLYRYSVEPGIVPPMPMGYGPPPAAGPVGPIGGEASHADVAARNARETAKAPVKSAEARPTGRTPIR